MSFPNKDYYKILQVDPSAESEVIEAAYKRLALKYHPDHNKSPNANERMGEIIEAYQVLRDPARRAQYDSQRASWTRSQSVEEEQRKAEEAERPRQPTAEETRRREQEEAEQRTANQEQQRQDATGRPRQEHIRHQQAAQRTRNKIGGQDKRYPIWVVILLFLVGALVFLVLGLSPPHPPDPTATPYPTINWFPTSPISYSSPTPFPPIVAVSITATKVLKGGTMVSLLATALIPADETARYTWDFGDGTTGSGQYVTHSYLNPGTYHVTVIVDSPRGFGGSSQDITVP